MIDASGRILAENTSQVILPPGAATSIIRLQNIGAVIFVNTGSPASPTNSYRLQPGEVIDESYLPVDANVTIYGPKGSQFVLKHD